MPGQERRRRKGPGGGDGPSLGGGQAVKVRMGALPGGEIKDYELEPGTTLGEALADAGLGRGEVRVNNRIEKDMSRVLTAGDQVFVLNKVRGN